jgi:FecR-like protein
MKFTKQNLLKLIVGFAVLGLAANLRAQTTPGKAVVRALKGSSTFSTAGSAPAPLKVNSVLYSGTTIKTGRDSQVDLFLGNSAGLVRVTENTTLSLDKLAFTETGADTVVEVQLNLPDGTILGNVNKLSAASKYEVKVPNGVAGIRGTQFRINSSAYVVLLNGSLIMVYVPSGGNPTPYPLFAPPPQYFSPLEGVKPAPDELISELRKQFGSGTLPPGPPADHPPGLINPPGNPTIFIEPGTGRPTTEH